MKKIMVWMLIFVLSLSACASPASPSPAPTQMPPQTPTTEPTPYEGPTTGPVVPGAPYPAGGDTPVSGQSGGTPGSLTGYGPQPGDSAWTRGEVFMDKDASQLTVMESNPVQVNLHLVGSLPNPCYQLRAVVTSSVEKLRVDLELYSVADPNQVCIQVLKGLDITLPLGSFSGGTYSVYINGELFGTFDS